MHVFSNTNYTKAFRSYKKVFKILTLSIPQMCMQLSGFLCWSHFFRTLPIHLYHPTLTHLMLDQKRVKWMWNKSVTKHSNTSIAYYNLRKIGFRKPNTEIKSVYLLIIFLIPRISTCMFNKYTGTKSRIHSKLTYRSSLPECPVSSFC